MKKTSWIFVILVLAFAFIGCSDVQDQLGVDGQIKKVVNPSNKVDYQSVINFLHKNPDWYVKDYDGEGGPITLEKRK
jgi:PBP1b-binding outer membrane lipoprotein LpoB